MKRYQYITLGLGAMLTFLGHGLWAVTLLNDKFPKLLAGSLSNTLGVHLADSTTNHVVRAIGAVDVTLSIVLALIVAGYVVGRGGLHRLAYSQVAVAIFAYGAVWGFLTALSRPLSAGIVWPEVLDVVERGPNFLLPLVLLVATVVVRRRATA